MKSYRPSFRIKLLLLTLAPLAIAQLVSLIAVMRTVEADVSSQANESLVIGSEVAAEFLAGRSEQLRTSIEVLSSDFGLKEAFATGDEQTIRSMLSNHSGRVGAEMAALFDLDGHLVASTLPAGTAIDDLQGAAESIIVIEDVGYHVFVEPLRAPVTVGWVVVGFPVDAALMRRLASLTGLDVSVVVSLDGGESVLASTHRTLTRGTDAASMLADETMLTLRTPFMRAGASRADVVLQRSIEDAMLPYVEARGGLIIFTTVLLAIVALVGALFSTTIARPLRTLSDAAQRMISGNYEGDVKTQSRDEFGELADSFNTMRVAIADREQRISHQALHNDLTDLPNRYKVLQSLTSLIEDSRAEERSVAVLSLRLAGMGEMASTLGHKAADEIIVQAARHLRVNLADHDFLGHTGSNEFVLILPDEDTESATARAERIDQILSSGVTVDNIDIGMRTETGIAVSPTHGEDPAELLRYASIARTEAETMRVPVRVYETGREDLFVRRLRIVSDLRNAIRQRDIQPWYQPKVCLDTGKVCGVEALVRWQHPEFGFMSPDEFIPAAEQAGTIVHLTRYVLAEAVKQCRRWRDEGTDLHIAVNLSTRDLTDEYLPYHVMQILKDEGVDPESLTVEVTESSIMRDLSRSILVLECLRDIGVQLSIDDFGTGHSSLSQLRVMPVHELKIDKSFVQDICDDPQNEAIVRATVDLAHSLNLRVVAEGVEDEATMRRIASLGCASAQGYFLNKPAPADEVSAWLKEFEPVVYRERRKHDRPFAKRA